MGLRDMSLCNIKREVSEHDKETSLLSVYIGVERHVSMQCRERCLCAVLRDMSLCPKERSPDNLKIKKSCIQWLISVAGEKFSSALGSLEKIG